MWDGDFRRFLCAPDVVVAAAPSVVEVTFIIDLFLLLLLFFLFLSNGSRMRGRGLRRELVRRDLRHADGALHLRRGRGELRERRRRRREVVDRRSHGGHCSDGDGRSDGRGGGGGGAGRRGGEGVRLALSELRESGASVLERDGVGGVSRGEGVARRHGQLHEQTPFLAARHRLLVLDPRLRATHCCSF